MRALLELLGIGQPDAIRREPVALPAWTRLLGPVVVGGLTLVSYLLYWALRLLLG